MSRRSIVSGFERGLFGCLAFTRHVFYPFGDDEKSTTSDVTYRRAGQTPGQAVGRHVTSRPVRADRSGLRGSMYQQEKGRIARWRPDRNRDRDREENRDSSSTGTSTSTGQVADGDGCGVGRASSKRRRPSREWQTHQARGSAEYIGPGVRDRRREMCCRRVAMRRL